MSKIKIKSKTQQNPLEKEYTYEDRVRDDKKRHDDFERDEYGTVTFWRHPKDAEHEEIIVVPVEIEVPSEVDSFVKMDILGRFRIKYSDWIQQCYIDPGVMNGKVTFRQKLRRAHIILWYIPN